MKLGTQELIDAIGDAIREAHFEVIEHWFKGFIDEEGVVVEDEIRDQYLQSLLPGSTQEERQDAAINLVGNNHAKQFLNEIPAPSKISLPGEEAFRIYDTFGLPRDFIEDTCRDLGIGFDAEGFERAMTEQRERARASWKGGAGKATASPADRELNKTVFEGYRQTESRNCEVLAIIREGQGVKELKA